MASSGMLHRVALVRTDVSEELGPSFIRVARTGELGTTLAVSRLLLTSSVRSSPVLATLMKEAPSSSETSVLTRATWRNIPEDAILHMEACSLLNIGMSHLMLTVSGNDVLSEQQRTESSVAAVISRPLACIWLVI
jgi:hypothetical protein